MALIDIGLDNSLTRLNQAEAIISLSSLDNKSPRQNELERTKPSKDYIIKVELINLSIFNNESPRENDKFPLSNECLLYMLELNNFKNANLKSL